MNGNRIPACTVSVRVNQHNLNHHLWLNNDTWWMHFTIYPTPITKQRVRCWRWRRERGDGDGTAITDCANGVQCGRGYHAATFPGRIISRFVAREAREETRRMQENGGMNRGLCGFRGFRQDAGSASAPEFHPRDLRDLRFKMKWRNEELEMKWKWK